MMYTVKYTMPCLLTGLFYGVTQLKPGGGLPQWQQDYSAVIFTGRTYTYQ